MERLRSERFDPNGFVDRTIRLSEPPRPEVGDERGMGWNVHPSKHPGGL